MDNEEMKIPKLQVLSVKVNTSVIEKWRENMQSGMYPTAGQFMETLIERYEENYSRPLRINKENEEIIADLRQKLDAVQIDNSKLLESIGTIEREREQLKIQVDELESKMANATESVRAFREGERGCIRVKVDDLDMMCLQYLADRENKSRNRNDITPDIFFLYCVREMLIKGNKFSIQCVPDSVISQFKKQLGNGK